MRKYLLITTFAIFFIGLLLPYCNLKNNYYIGSLARIVQTEEKYNYFSNDNLRDILDISYLGTKEPDPTSLLARKITVNSGGDSFMILEVKTIFDIKMEELTVDGRAFIKPPTKKEATIPYPSTYNYYQTTNDCGPYNTAAIVRALKNVSVSSSKFAENIGWRLPNKYTLPWGLEEQLKQNEIRIKIYHLKKYTDQEKLSFLKYNLSDNKPIIILGKKNNWQHYITLLGYDSDKEIVYVYDSYHEKGQNGLTKDDNGEKPGNRNLKFTEILDFWRGGGMYGLYKWYALVAG
jgi:hypothetical protein